MQFKSPDQLIAYLDDEDIRFHKVGVFDTDGVLRGKYMDRKKFESALREGFGFCDVVLGWDSGDQLFDNTKVSGWHTGYRDAPVSLDLRTVRRLPGEEDTVLVLGQFEGDYAAVCPRQVLQRIIAKAQAMGLYAQASLEYEFFVFNETPESARAKGYRKLETLTPGMFGYSMLRSGVHAELYHDLLETMDALECPIEGLHTETGPGVIEAALRYTEALAAADQGALFKTFTKILAQRQGLMATFMAKWSNDYPGQSGHIHVSLEDLETRENLMFDANDPDGLSQTMRWFLGGQVVLMPQLLAMICATVNAYRRLVPGMWAPTHATWGIENRTTAIRAIPAGAKATRSEYRVGPADANPHLAVAAALASGLWGIENKIEPPPMVRGNAYENAGEAERLPRSLGEAAERFAASEVARELFGDTFVDHFAATREWEDRQARKAVTDWELARYFEII